MALHSGSFQHRSWDSGFYFLFQFCVRFSVIVRFLQTLHLRLARALSRHHPSVMPPWAAGWKVMRVLMVAMLPGVVEAAGLVRDACQTFRFDFHFEIGCSFAMTRTPAECDTRCVRHRPHVLLAPPASPTAALRVRFTTWCCTRSFVC